LFRSFFVLRCALFSVTFWLCFALFFRFFRFRATLQILFFWFLWFCRAFDLFLYFSDKFFNFLWVLSKIRRIDLRFCFPRRSFWCNFYVRWKLLALLLCKPTLFLWLFSSRRFGLQFYLLRSQFLINFRFFFSQLLICFFFCPFRSHLNLNLLSNVTKLTSHAPVYCRFKILNHVRLKTYVKILDTQRLKFE